MDNGLELEEGGGDVPSIPVSALTRMNLDALQEAILMQAELAELKTEVSG